MKISIDGGALCSKNQSGNKIFTENLVEAISRYDKKNNYIVYTFCNKKISLKKKILLPRLGWSKLRIGIEEFIHPNDVYLALNQSLPLFGPKKIIAFSHGISFKLFPDFYKNKSRLDHQLKNMLERSDKVIVSSIKVKRELIDIFRRSLEFVNIPFGVPFDMQEYKKVKREKFFLFVGENHRIKNVDLIVELFKYFNNDKDYQLVLVGDHIENKKENISVIRMIERNKLRDLYRSATAYLSSSHYESFNFPVLEALAQNCPVIGLDSAIIPEMKKYVMIANNQNDFLQKMITVSNSKRYNIDRDKLKNEFSWKKYIWKLQQLY